MGLHDVLVLLHGWLRWAVLLAGVAVLVRTAFTRRGRAWADADTKLLRAFIGLFDLQLAVGLLMHFATSALGVRALALGGAAMKDHVLRFFAVEHLTGMLVAAAVLHVGSARARRLGEDPARQARTLVFVAIGLVIVIASIPWPFLPYGRPLVPTR